MSYFSALNLTLVINVYLDALSITISRKKNGKIRIMVGYSRERRKYQIYDPEKEIVLKERSVKFNKLELGNKLIKTNNCEETYNCNYNSIILNDEEEINTNVNIEYIVGERSESEERLNDHSYQQINESDIDISNKVISEQSKYRAREKDREG